MEPERKAPESEERSASRRENGLVREDCDQEQDFTEVENAHAAGAGAMGRNDEKLPTSPDEVEERRDPPY